MAKKATEQITLEVDLREKTGTANANKVRRQGAIPGVVYGKGKDPISISIDYDTLAKVLRSASGEHGLITLTIKGAKGAAAKPVPVLIKDLQHHPVDGHAVHVDFQSVSMTERIHVPVAIHLVGEAEGVRVGGGILEHFLREVEIECLPKDIPQQVDLDISKLKIGDSLHVSDVKIPDNMEIINDSGATIVTVTPPRVDKTLEEAAETAEQEAGAEPEVIREKKEAEGSSE